MALNQESEVREVTGISEDEKQCICYFLQGAVYCWCKNKDRGWFALRDLMGGENYYWQGTPMLALYHKHEGQALDPVNEAGKDAGWLLKSVIASDKRLFDTKVEALVRHYKWIGGEEDT